MRWANDPIDDVGYHLYVAQGLDSAPAEVGTSAGANRFAAADKWLSHDRFVAQAKA